MINKKFILLCCYILIWASNTYPSLFEEANNLYLKSDYQNAEYLYEQILNTTNENEIEKEELLEAYVNLADTKWALGKLEDACYYWQHRIEAGKFGRKQLENEWQGEDLHNKTITVFSERSGGAFGDTFIMTWLLRFLKESNENCNIIFISQKPLKGILNIQNYIDDVLYRDDELPETDYQIYLWSLLNCYLTNNNNHIFPIEAWLSAPNLTEDLTRTLDPLKNKLLIGFWYRGAGAQALAADYRSLNRALSADKFLKFFGNISNVQLICLEGMGHHPVNEANHDENKHDNIDLTEESLKNVTIFNQETFDRVRGAFVDTFAVMKYIKEQNGLLIGIDTSLLMIAAGIEGNNNTTDHTVFALLNKEADFRWGDSTENPREWNISNETLILQCPEQNEWDIPLKIAQDLIMDRLENK